MALDLDGLVPGGAPRRVRRDPVTARVVRAGPGGLFVAPVGSDTRHPIGPCRGPGGLSAGDIVLLIFTTERPWVAAVDDTGA